MKIKSLFVLFIGLLAAFSAKAELAIDVSGAMRSGQLYSGIFFYGAGA